MQIEDIIKRELGMMFAPLLTMKRESGDVLRGLGVSSDGSVAAGRGDWVSFVVASLQDLISLRAPENWGEWVSFVGRAGNFFLDLREAVESDLTEEQVERLVAVLAAIWLRNSSQVAFTVMDILGLLQVDGDVSIDSLFPRPAFLLDLDRLALLIDDPKRFFVTLLGQDLSSPLERRRYILRSLVPRLARIMRAIGVQTTTNDEGLEIRFALGEIRLVVRLVVQLDGTFTLDLNEAVHLSYNLGNWCITAEGAADHGTISLIRQSPSEHEMLFSAGVNDLGIFAQEFGIGFGFRRSSPPDWWVEFIVKKFRASVDPTEGGGFLGDLSGGATPAADVDLSAKITSSGDFLFAGNAGAGARIPLSARVGPIRLRLLDLGLKISGHQIEVYALLNFDGNMGPLQAAVTGFGLVSTVSLPGGGMGSASFGVELSLPEGIGVTVGAGPVSGSGFINHERESGRYLGAVSLDVSGVSLHAIGVLDSRLDSSPGYSLLILVSAEFTPVQLGMGFTLNGVGGLCGIQRSVALPALQASVRTGSLTPLLFPRDPVGQASQLVTGLQRIFPPTKDRYVFGPMFKLGWGTPTIVTIDFGIILQLPAPISVALIGTINMIFPDQSVPTPIVAIHIDIAGSLDTGAKTLAIDASLRDSKIAGYDLTGDMALRLSWGDRPDFALSIGGFHKAFKPPQGFPELRRLSLGMVQSAFRLTCSAFLAVTSNTFQIGARAELFAEAAGFNVFGYVEFDALITFSPFSFRFDFAAGLALRRGTSVIMGISVAGMISGPNPWHVQGSASISLLFFEISISFDKTFGDTAAEPLPETVNLWEKLQAAVQDLHNWIADPAPDAVRVVSCASPPAADGQPRLDPLGTLGFHQRVLPLARRVTKFGEKHVEAPTTLSLSTASVGEHEVHAPQTVQENFAASQFQQLSDADKLSRPSFEAMPAGAVLSLDALTVHAPKATDLAYRVIAIREDQTRVLFDVLAVPSALDLTTSLVAIADQAPLRASAERRYAPPRAAVPLAMLEDDHVIVVNAATLRPASFRDQPTVSPGEAHDAIAARLREHPDELGAWRVVPVQDARMDHAA